jgi:hypothetical protein
VALAIGLVFSSAGAYLPQGQDGAMPLIGGVGTRYYSIPGLVVDPSRSMLSIGGGPVALESGKFWFDHQWGLGLVPTGSPRHAFFVHAASTAPR